jgi:hypothetical protein
MLDEWSGDDVDELFELLDAQLGDIGVDVKFEKKPAAAAAEEEEEGRGERRRVRRGRGPQTKTKTTRTKRKKRGRRRVGLLVLDVSSFVGSRVTYARHVVGALLFAGRFTPHFSIAHGT